MKKLFIGLDVSKDVFDFCALNDLGEEETPKKVFENSKKGIDQFCKSLNKWSDCDILICLEHTGHYGYLLSYELAQRNLKYALINPLEIKKSIGMTRGKNDAIDAYRIAYYAMTHFRKIKQHILPIEDL